MNKHFKKLLIFASLLAISCSNSHQSSPDNTNLDVRRREKITLEEGTNIALSSLEYTLFEYGFESSEAVASTGDNTFVGIVYSDFTTYSQDENGVCYFEAGFFQIIPNLESTDNLLTPDLITDDNPIMAVDGSGVQFVITKSIANFESFSFVIDDWYNKVKRVGEMILEVNSYKNESQYYDYDVSCYSYDSNEWLFKSDEDIAEFNLEAIGLYTDYTQKYIEAVKMLKELIAIQDKASEQFSSFRIVLISKELLTEESFKNQQGTINGVLLSDLLEAQENLNSNQSIYISPNGVEVISNDGDVLIDTIVKGLSTAAGIAAFIVGLAIPGGGVVGTVLGVVFFIGGLAISAFDISEGVMQLISDANSNFQNGVVNILKNAIVSLFNNDLAYDIATSIFGVASIVSTFIPTGPGISTLVSLGSELLGKLTYINYSSLLSLTSTRILNAAEGVITYLTEGNIDQLINQTSINEEYKNEYSNILAAINLSVDIGVTNKIFNFYKINKKQYALRCRDYFADAEYKTVYDSLKLASIDAELLLKNTAAKDITELQKEPRSYGFALDNADDNDVIDFLKENNRMPAFVYGDSIQCDYIQAVSIEEITDAILNKKISLEEGISFVGNSLNGMLTSHISHLNICFGSSYAQYQLYEIIAAFRPETEQTIMSFIAKIH